MKALSRTDANAALDMIALCTDCQTQSDFVSLVENLRYLVGFSHARCGLVDLDKFNKGDAAGMKMILNYPEKWEERYLEKGYLSCDRVAAQSFLMPGALFFWDKKETINRFWPEKLKMSQDSKAGKCEYSKMMDEASFFGISTGWLYSSLVRRYGERSFLAFAGDGIGYDQRSRMILDHVLPHMDRTVISLLSRPLDSFPDLTPRESEILSWISEGKTAWEISRILNISSKTVEFHKGNILRKLDAVNTQQAVAIAVSTGAVCLA